MELAEGITLLNFGSGHAWGMLGLHIEMPESGGIILASDTELTKRGARVGKMTTVRTSCYFTKFAQLGS